MKSVVFSVLVALFASAAFAQVTIISDDLNGDTSADYTIVNGGPGAGDGTVEFGFDYSELLAGDGNPIPPAPGTTDDSKTGLHLTVNRTGGAQEAYTLFHNTEIVGVTDYTMTVDVFMGVWDAAVGTGTTEHVHVGVAGDGVTSNQGHSPISGSGNYVFITSDGGDSSDYRHFRANANGGDNYGPINQFDADYLSTDSGTNVSGDNFPFFESISNFNAPFPGMIGDGWATIKVEVLQSESKLKYYVRGSSDITTGDPGNPAPAEFVQIVESDLFDTDGFVSIGLADLYSSVAQNVDEQFAIFDNLFVEGTNQPTGGGGGDGGDFDDDGNYACADIDALSAEIVAGTNDASFDLTGDGTVNLADRDAWLAEAGAANLASEGSFSVGDTDLNGVVNSTDLGMLLNNFGATSGVPYCGGDLNVDSNVDSTDLGLLLNSFGQAASASAVPEPGSILSIFAGLFVGIASLRRRR